MKIPVADSEEIDLFVRGFEIKKYREMICKTYIAEERELSMAVIDNWKFKRIYEKYVTKVRMYDENSYSKKMMRLEEKKFIHKIHLFQTYINFMENQIKFERELNHLLEEPEYEKSTEELYEIIFDKWEALLRENV